MKSGVYKIVCNQTGEFYIGSTCYLKKRKSEHFTALAKGQHYNRYLQECYNNNGVGAFSFQVLEALPAEELTARENHYLSMHTDDPLMLNICKSTLADRSDNFRQSMSVKLKNHVRTESHKRNFYDAHICPIRVHTPTEVFHFNSVHEAAKAFNVNFNTLRVWMSDAPIVQPCEQVKPSSKYKHLVDTVFVLA